MIIHNATITGSMHLNGMDMSRMTGSLPTEQFNQFTASVNGFTNSYNTASFSGSFKGDGSQLTNISASGIIGLNLSQISSGEAIASIDASGFNVNTGATISGSLIVTNQIVAQSLNVQQVTSSIVFSSGSNVFGNSLANTQMMTGSVSVTGSLKINNQNVVPENRTLSINGIIFDLSANRSWEIAAGVTSFNTRTGAITLSSGDVTTALGYTPYNSTNPNGYISGINSGMVTTALGYTPVPNTRTLTINGTAFDLSADRSWEIAAGVTSVSAGTGISVNQTTGAITITNTITNNNQLTNGAGYITGINSTMVTNALGFTPYNATNPSGYITSAALSSYLPLSGGTMTGKILAPSFGTDVYGGAFEIRERGYVSSTQSDWSFSPAISFHWGNRFAVRLGFDASGFLAVDNVRFLNANNFNSYSPTLTGGGASGTWGISITGNAATITSQANSATITASTGVNASHIVQRDGNGYIYANHINFNTPETENPSISSFITSNGDGWSRKSSLAHVRNQLGNYGGWITGLSFDGLSSKTGGTGTYQTSGDFRAPIFYDSNDTAYYLNPAGGSRLRNLYVGDSGDDWSDPGGWGTQVRFSNAPHVKFVLHARSPGIEAGMYVHTPGSVFMGSYTAHVLSLMYAGNMRMQIEDSRIYSNVYIEAAGSLRAPIFYDSNDTAFYIDPASTSNTNSMRASEFRGNANVGGTGEATWHPAGAYIGGTMWQYGAMYKNNTDIYDISTGYANGSLRAPIFYDNNDTGYYGDFASTSSMNSVGVNSLYIRSLGSGYYFTAGSWGFRHQTPSGYIEFGPANTGHAHIYTDRSNFYFNAQIQVNGGSQINTSDIRANIFYDQQDTAYYLDPNNVSRLVSLSVGEVYGHTYPGIVQSGYNSYNYNFYNGSWSGSVTLGYLANCLNQWEFGIHDSGHRVASAFLFDGGDTNRILMGRDLGWGTTYIEAASSFRAPIFYDSNDTGYYADFNSTSDTAIRLRGGILMGPNPTWGAYLQVGGNGRNNSSAASVVATSGNLHLDAANGYNTYLNYYSGGLIYVGTNTAYYITSTGDYYTGTSASSNALNGWAFTSYIYKSGGTGYYQADNWIQMNTNAGIYWPNHYGLHILANVSSTYTQLRIDGSKNGYSGFYDIHSSVNGAMYDSGGNGGVYREANGRWYWYHHIGNNCMGVGTSSTNSAFGIWVTKGGYFDGRVDGTIFYDANNTAFYFDGSSTGDSIRVAGDVVAYYSDERLKDIKGNIPDALSKVMSLDGFYYEPNEIAQSYGYEKKLQVGLSAQQVESILPEIIKDAPIGNGYKTVDYGKLVPLLVEAIKEQQQQIEELKSIVNAFTK